MCEFDQRVLGAEGSLVRQAQGYHQKDHGKWGVVMSAVVGVFW